MSKYAENGEFLFLTEHEIYVLNTILGYVISTEETQSVLKKIDDLLPLELKCEDYDKVSFEFSNANGTQIIFGDK